MNFRAILGLALATTFLFGATAKADIDDPLQIFVSKDTQSLAVYDGAAVVATSNVSTGKPGHTTPSGVFSVLEKRKTHFSNLYDDAPMPFMQRLTWSGVALHESGHVPRYPASHGCVRMPGDFAKMLFGMTKRGYHVVITNREIAPQPMPEIGLFKPRYPAQPGDLLSDAAMRPSMPTTDGSIEIATAETLPKLGAGAVAELPKPQPALKLLITRVTERHALREVQAMLNQLGYDAGDETGTLTTKTAKAIKAYQTLHGQKPTGQANAAFKASLYKVLNRKAPTGWLYARQNFKPVFDGPVDIAEPDLALGTHFYHAVGVHPAQRSADWYGVTLDNQIPAKQAVRLGIVRQPDAQAADAAQAAFERIAIPTDLRNKIEVMMGSGSSLTITDAQDNLNTGDGTDFITTTVEPRKAG
ncbi:peptidoglycan hydrolase-like protein with peptidoglycan-binding domain [Rhizobium sp. SG_E_25_P2]|uniref:L,D-transpeptidase family protein n=1 Tax=Rhizobium sp. SG_E_25_P2 TaxID=2879942 RepID=UPI0024758213|nr:L,D-transpeptidase family protein [Rhizobium sp. SG_E_25_P2]MDH6266769.1 peptidoglycan hydrolase-like protein with peptidoglycan-binding domain [Rhizobium sp. SG_E_25_P2]